MTGRRWPRRRQAVVLLVLGALVALGAGCSGDDGGAGGDDGSAGAPTSSEAPARTPDGYVALGDSFSSGVGAPPYDPDSGRCQRSDVSWPHLLVLLADADADADPEAGERGRGLDLDEVDLRACGGATIDELLEQIDSAPDGSPDDEVGLVTLTIGGNDVGFTQLVTQCVLADCSAVPTGASFAASLAELGDRLVDEVYPALRTAFPEATIVHVGYPRLTAASGPVVPECGWLSASEQPATVALVDALNDRIAAAVGRASTDEELDVRFVDVAGAFAGHEVCTTDPWVHPISLDPERAHPTPEGYDALATAVHAVLVG